MPVRPIGVFDFPCSCFWWGALNNRVWPPLNKLYFCRIKKRSSKRKGRWSFASHGEVVCRRCMSAGDTRWDRCNGITSDALKQTHTANTHVSPVLGRRAFWKDFVVLSEDFEVHRFQLPSLNPTLSHWNTLSQYEVVSSAGSPPPHLNHGCCSKLFIIPTCCGFVSFTVFCEIMTSALLF